MLRLDEISAHRFHFAHSTFTAVTKDNPLHAHSALTLTTTQYINFHIFGKYTMGCRKLLEARYHLELQLNRLRNTALTINIVQVLAIREKSNSPL